MVWHSLFVPSVACNHRAHRKSSELLREWWLVVFFFPFGAIAAIFSASDTSQKHVVQGMLWCYARSFLSLLISWLSNRRAPLTMLMRHFAEGYWDFIFTFWHRMSTAQCVICWCARYLTVVCQHPDVLFGGHVTDSWDSCNRIPLWALLSFLIVVRFL